MGFLNACSLWKLLISFWHVFQNFVLRQHSLVSEGNVFKQIYSSLSVMKAALCLCKWRHHTLWHWLTKRQQLDSQLSGGQSSQNPSCLVTPSSLSQGRPLSLQVDQVNTIETLYNTVNLCRSTHKRHSVARPKGWGMGCLLWVQRATYCVDLSKLSSIKYLL